jgi:predicted Zn-dependent protease with MMP-like domain
MRTSDAAFEALVTQALDLVPAEFKPYLENVEILVEAWPSRALLKDLGVPEEEGLYGLYSGTALTERSFLHAELPDRITLFRDVLLEDFPDPEELRREIAITVLHELAHHLGIGEERLEELGLD